MGHFKMTCYGIAAMFVVVTGCAPSATEKPDLSASSAGSSGSKTPTSASSQGEGKRGTAKETTADRSSLSELQEGKSADSAGPLKDIFYDYDSHNLRADARDTLRANADWLKRNPAARVEIEGHCDERGTNEYNLALGAKRAQAAKDFLTTLGVGAERLSTISYGEEIPVCKEASEGCWQRNRRARFVVLPSRPAS
jgi:peptidoglycan-associated lipoprotein